MRPDLAGGWIGRGNTLARSKHYADALRAYNEALARMPDAAEAWLGLGNVQIELEHYDAASAAFERVLALQPDSSKARLGCANVLFKLKRYGEAERLYDEILEREPAMAEAWLGRGNALSALKRNDGAFVAYDRALELKLDLAGAWVGRGNLLLKIDRRDDALRAFEKALTLESDLAEAWLGRGNSCTALRHYDEAFLALSKCRELKPNFAELWLAFGNLYLAQDRHDDALAALDLAIKLQDDLPGAWLGRGAALVWLNRRDEALAAYEKALALAPDSPEAWHAYGYLHFELNRIDEALEALDKALAIRPDYEPGVSCQIFVLDFADAGFEKQQAARSAWWRDIGFPIHKRARIAHRNSRNPDRRIKLGYVSADFRRHSAARCFRPMLANHDKAKFEVICYSLTLQEDEVTKEFEQAADRWHRAAQLSDEELNSLILADQIDILIDLSGYTAGHRLEVFARKPAPIQVSAGATGTGLSTIDYLFSDPVTCPADVRPLFAEKIYDLPCIMTIETLPTQLRPSDPPVLSKGYVTFGAFNRITKISDQAVAVWARILKAVPRSELVIKHYALDEPAARDRMLKRFSEHEIGPDRLKLLGGTSHEEHLAAFKDIDISLDPFPQNGGISTLEVLADGRAGGDIIRQQHIQSRRGLDHVFCQHG